MASSLHPEFNLWSVYDQNSISPEQESYDSLAELFSADWDTSVSPHFHAPYRNQSSLRNGFFQEPSMPPVSHMSPVPHLPHVSNTVSSGPHVSSGPLFPHAPHMFNSPPRHIVSSGSHLSPVPNTPPGLNLPHMFNPSVPLVPHVSSVPLVSPMPLAPRMLNTSSVPLAPRMLNSPPGPNVSSGSHVPLVSSVPPVPLVVSPVSHSHDTPTTPRDVSLCQVSLPPPRRGHNSLSTLVRRLEPLSCVFRDAWVPECEDMDRPGVDLVAVVTQLISLDRIRQKKPEELKSIMRDTLSEDQLIAVLNARKRKMRKSAKRERTINTKKQARYSGSILPPVVPYSNPPIY